MTHKTAERMDEQTASGLAVGICRDIIPFLIEHNKKETLYEEGNIKISITRLAVGTIADIETTQMLLRAVAEKTDGECTVSEEQLKARFKQYLLSHRTKFIIEVNQDNHTIATLLIGILIT